MSEETLRNIATAMPLWSQLLCMFIFASVLLYTLTYCRENHRERMRSLALDDTPEGPDHD
jgi:hypothetical protein